MASAGALLLLRRRLAVGLLLLLGGGAVFGFTVNYSWPELGVLLIPAILVLWLVAAVGAEATVRLAARRAPWAPTMAALVTLGAPLWLLGHNLAADDLTMKPRQLATSTTSSALSQIEASYTAKTGRRPYGQLQVAGRRIGDGNPFSSRARRT